MKYKCHALPATPSCLPSPGAHTWKVFNTYLSSPSWANCKMCKIQFPCSIKNLRRQTLQRLSFKLWRFSWVQRKSIKIVSIGAKKSPWSQNTLIDLESRGKWLNPETISWSQISLHPWSLIHPYKANPSKPSPELRSERISIELTWLCFQWLFTSF